MITPKELNNINLDHLDKYLCEKVKLWFYDFSGKEHYRLLNYLCRDKELVIDIGTYRGGSCVAMSSAKKVVSYDIKKQEDICKLPSNCEYVIGDALNESILSADVILLDTYHDGVFERKAIDYLIDNNYKGWLIMDDIRAFDKLVSLWNEIKLPKEDITRIGHHSGTGIIYFNEDRI